MEYLFEIIPGIITALVGAYFAARWSLKKFYSEKWWDRKEQAYAEIINALYDIIQYCEIQKEDYGQGASYSEEREKELAKNYTAGYWKVKRATDVGAFVISPRAEKVLRDLKERPQLIWEENPSWEIYEADYKAHQKALIKIVTIAKEDLGAKDA